MRVGYNLLESADPEERLEDAALFKAIHDAFPEGSVVGLHSGLDVVPPCDVYYGREKLFGAPRPPLRYWEDPVFLANAGRSFKTLQIDEAEVEVRRLHGLGKHAFVKDTRDKKMALKVPRGKTIHDVIEDNIYTYIDGGPPLMVQEFYPMIFEHRFFVVNRKIVTDSPNAVHLTPLDFNPREVYYSSGQLGYRTPRHRRPERRATYWRAHMVDLVRRVARTMERPDAVIDVAFHRDYEDRPVLVEFNPLVVGGVGLFACDVRALAKAIRKRDYVK